ncbi:carbamoyl phosphate synthase small subunit [Bacillus piscicola]|uniref:carbamoyl phosphate synthase small subunit n=1 Tax=Bacillus piscicola TaxID=1632684 RepID=UPI001F09256A|nr:carbamoyl phosphate synthase small subunit [Bacillus piscicola]
MNRKLILENGAVFTGKAIGSKRESTGEIIFYTGMTGHQEVLSNPSSCEQIVAMTYPLITGSGINRDDFETLHPVAGGVIVKEAVAEPSNFRSIATLDEWLAENDIPGISGIDTRMLTRMLRSEGTLCGRIANEDADTDRVVAELQEYIPSLDKVEKVSTKNAYHAPGFGRRVVLIDYGAKHSIARNLIERNCDLFVLPFRTSAKEVLKLNPDGVMLSNGPGSPANITEAVDTVQELIGKLPIFGIGLGYQLLCAASGAAVVKMKYGRHGSGHPVRHVKSGKVEITAQNHDYLIELESLQGTELEATHLHVNDGTLQGVSHTGGPAFGVQFQPEASPGPDDANHIFDAFVKMMDNYKNQPIKG